MRKIFSILCLILLAGCASFLKQNNRWEGIALQSLPPYSGLRARIALADFEVNTGKATAEMGSELHELLMNYLTATNRFYFKGQDSANNFPADLIISIALVEFDPQASGGKAGIGGGGGVNSGIMGGLLENSLNKAHLSLEVRIIDAVSPKQEVIASGRVNGQASDYIPANTRILLGGRESGKGLSVYNHTPMEKAIYIAMAETARFVTENIPVKYYKY